MKKVIFFNHRNPICGVFQFGKRVHSLIEDTQKVHLFYHEIESAYEYNSYLNWYQPDYIVYNWHRGTMAWLTEEMVSSNKNSKHYFLFHEEFARKNYDKYLFFGDYDMGSFKFEPEKKVLLPRPLLIYNGTYPKNDVITIGSFGFGFWQKGFHTLVTLVNKTFNKAVINLHMPKSFFGDPLGEHYKAVAKACKRLNTNRNIKLNITYNFLDDEGVLKFLADNDINVFLYTENGEGISSVIDYALSVKRPIAISNCNMFRHILKPEILVENFSIQDILNNGTKPLQEFYSRWSIDKFREGFEDLFDAD